MSSRIWNWRLLIALLITILLLVFAGITARKEKGHLLVMGRQTFTYELVQTPNAREKGLSGRKDMPSDHAMIFVFQQASNYCFWMKEMHFPLDMIWLNSSRQVVHIIQNVSPATFPQQFCPDKPSMYTIEVNAGVAAKAGLREGQQVSF